MASLKIKTGHKREVEKGYVEINGQCVQLMEIVAKNDYKLVFAYCLMPGETVTGEGEDYVVEF